MRKRGGFRKTLFYLGAVAFWLTLGAPLPRADLFPPGALDPSTLHIGPGVNYQAATDAGFSNLPGCGPNGGCFIWDSNGDGIYDELNELHKPTMSLVQNSGGANVLNNPVLLIFAVPLENLIYQVLGLGDPLNPDLNLANIVDLDGIAGGTQVKLYQKNTFPWSPNPEPSTPPTSSLNVSFVPPALYGLGSYVQGSQWNSGNIYDFLGLVGDDPSASIKFASIAQALKDIPEDLFGAIIAGPSAFKVFVYVLETAAFGGGDGIRIDYQNVPLGTLVTAWGVDIDYKTVRVCTGRGRNRVCHDEQVPDYKVYGTPITEAALVMPPPGPPPPPPIPEPTSLLLLGTGLLALGKLARRKKH